MKEKITKVIDICVGLKPAFNKPVLIVYIGGETVIVPITSKNAKRLVDLNVNTQG